MVTVTSVEAQSRFGELIDRAQREPVEVTRRGRTVACVVSEHDMREPAELKRQTSDAPSPWIARFAPLIPAGGEVLDLACGAGRHARFLAGLGYRVEAVDRDAAALANLVGVDNVTTRCADLENGPWPYYAHVFDGIVVSRYLWRPLFPQIFNCLGEGGVLIVETFMEGQQLYGKPSNPAFLLRPGELLELVGKRFTVVAFEQGEISGEKQHGKLEGPPREFSGPPGGGVSAASASGGAQVIQRICVRRGRPDKLPT